MGDEATAVKGGYYAAPQGPAPPNLQARPPGQAGPAPPVFSPDEEKRYQAWRATLPQRLQYEGDYDLRGFFRKNPNFSVSTPGQHMTDEFKLPNHETFSDESRYADQRHPGGHWNGDKFTPPPPAANGQTPIPPPDALVAGIRADRERRMGKLDLRGRLGASDPGGTIYLDDPFDHGSSPASAVTSATPRKRRRVAP